MDNPIEFASPEDNQHNNTPWNQSRGNNNYEDLILRPEYVERRLRFQPGQTWFRILPALASSKFGWMMPLHVLGFTGGRFCHPRTYTRGVKCAFDAAYAWCKEHAPTSLYSKANKTKGVRLLSDPWFLFWTLVEQGGTYTPRLLLASGYDGSRGGAPGLGHKIWALCQQRDETGAPVADAIGAESGVLVCVEKNQPKGAKYPNYHLTLGRQPRPVAELLKLTAPEEQKALCPLEHTIRRLSEEEEWERLGKVMAPDTVQRIRDSVGIH